VKPKLVRGDDGIFDVVAGGRTVFSKHEALRFPEEDEILRLLERKGA